MNGVIHPVIQFSMALMEPQRADLTDLGVELHESLSYSLGLVAMDQAQLDEVGSLPFVRSMFKIPDCYRESDRRSCDPFEYGEWSFVQGRF